MEVRELTQISPQHCRSARTLTRLQTGLQLVELMLAVAIIGILASISIPMFSAMGSKGDESQAVNDVNQIALLLDNYYLEHGLYPDSLAAIGMDHLKDPWGNSYQYLKIEGCATKGKKTKCDSKVRKDKSLHPLNTDYDLYSMGEDGKSNIPLTAKASRDDIVRANNGKYVGLAEDY